MVETGIESVIGKTKKDAGVEFFFGAMNISPVVDSFGEMEIFSYPETGVDIYFNKEGEVCTIFLYGFSDEDHGKYKGNLPHSLTFNDDQLAVGQKLGVPVKSGIEKNTGFSWERFDFEQYCIHVQYFLGCLDIQMVTLMSPGMANGNI